MACGPWGGPAASGLKGKYKGGKIPDSSEDRLGFFSGRRGFKEKPAKVKGVQSGYVEEKV